MQKKIIIVLAVLLVGSGAFYGGMKYAQGKTPTNVGRSGMGMGNFANLTPEERQARLQQFGATGMGGNRGTRGPNGAGGGFSGGEIIAKDDKSITIKLQDGGSKIVFLSASTTVMKAITGSPADLTVGTQVSAGGSANSDGSITAQSIQIRQKM